MNQLYLLLWVIATFATVHLGSLAISISAISTACVHYLPKYIHIKTNVDSRRRLLTYLYNRHVTFKYW